MRNLIIGAFFGAVAAWLYQSRQLREQLQQQLNAAPSSFREGVGSMASATTGSVQRVAQSIEGTQLPPQAKEQARAAAAAVQSVTEKMVQAAGSSVPDNQQPTTGPASQGEQPSVPAATTPAIAKSLIPDDVKAEEDAAARAAAQAQRERQAGD